MRKNSLYTIYHSSKLCYLGLLLSLLFFVVSFVLLLFLKAPYYYSIVVFSVLFFAFFLHQIFYRKRRTIVINMGENIIIIRKFFKENTFKYSDVCWYAKKLFSGRGESYRIYIEANGKKIISLDYEWENWDKVLVLRKKRKSKSLLQN